MDELSTVAQEREVIAKLLETMELYLLRIVAQRSLLEDLLDESALNEVLGELESRLAPIAHLRLEPLFDDILARPRTIALLPDWDQIALELVESANDIQLPPS